MAVEGTVYLLHFERPYKGKMRHYLGWTSDLERRLANHRQGTACATPGANRPRHSPAEALALVVIPA